MKILITFLTALLVFAFSQSINAQIYVNVTATGNNDGTSWQDAYTTLHDALESYNVNDTIWVAAGTYLPQMPSAWTGIDKNTFYIYQDVKLYGGFNGTETALAERDPITNVTILSGDMNGDDVMDDFDNNRADNVKNVMYIDTMVTTATIIDGFTIMGGHADGDFNVLNTNDVGAGIWSYGSPQISHCRFTQNYALNAGGGLFLFGTSSVEAIVDNCVFERNKSNGGGGMVIQSSIPLGLVQVSNCQFINNIADFVGGAFGIRSSLVEMTNCQFTGNNSQNAGGAIMYYNIEEGDNELTLIDCTFDNNTSNHGGAFYHDSNGTGNDKFIFTNCEFTNNQAITSPDYIYPDGGALGFQYTGGNPTNDTIIISACTFQGNSAERVGGGIVFFDDFGTDTYFEINNTSFHNNIAQYGGGVQTIARGTNQKVRLLNCEFLDNQAQFFGGGFRSESKENNLQVTVEDCIFEGNQAILDGGGIEVAQLEQAETYLVINNSQFLNNSAGNEGAGVNFYTQDNGSASIEINHSLFDGNSNDETGNAEEGAGGFSLINFGIGSVDLNFESTIFSNNTSLDGAGAIQLLSDSNDEVKLNNCLLIDNSGGEYGGGIGIEGTLSLSILNTTIADNNSGITHSNGLLELQNTILYNPEGTDYMGLESSSVISHGGNLIGDESLMNVLLSTDQSEVDPLFLGNGDYQLQASSPAVDAGLDTGVTVAFDLAGNTRIQGNQVDVGAYESPFTVSTKEVLISNQALTMYPNPATDFLNILLENNWTGEIQVDIVNVLGQKIYTTQFNKASDEYADNIPTSQLTNGTYQLILSNRQEVIVKSFTKVAN